MAATSLKTPLMEERPVIVTNEDNEKSGAYTMNNSNEPSIIEQNDMNYCLEVSKIDMGEIEAIEPTDYIRMRKWLKNTYMNLPKEPRTLAHRTRPSATIKVTDVLVPSDDDKHFFIRVYDPILQSKLESTEKLRPAVILYHGGGWIHGSPQCDHDLSKFFASELQGVMFGVDYRLAPENPFPLPHNDCYKALEWVLENASLYKVDPGKVGLWGASAGGNLAAGVALRDSAEHETSRIRHVNLVAPATYHPHRYPSHLLTASGSMERFRPKREGKDFRVELRKLWDMYTNGEIENPYASMLHADLRPNHAPVHTTVAGCDVIRDEGIDYALRLRNAGIDSQLEIIPGVPHAINLSPDTYVARQFFRNQARVLNTALNSDF